MVHWSNLLLALALGALTPASLAAQSSASALSRWSVWGGPTVDAPTTSGSVTSRFALPSVSTPSGVAQGSAAQTLALDDAHGAGFEVGATYFPLQGLGLEVVVDRDRLRLGGANSGYRVSATGGGLSYDRTLPWPPTEGSVQQVSVGVNGAVRRLVGHRTTVTLSGGLLFVHLSGEAQALGFSEAYYTDVLLPSIPSYFAVSNYQARFALEPSSGVGFDGGAEVDVPCTRRISVVADLRDLGAPALQSQVAITGLTSSDDAVHAAPTLESVQASVGAAAVSLSPSRVRLMVGIRVRKAVHPHGS